MITLVLMMIILRWKYFWGWFWSWPFQDENHSKIFLGMIAHPTESRHTQRPDRSSHGELLQMFGKKDKLEQKMFETKDKWDQSTEHFGFWTTFPGRLFLKTKHVTSFCLLQFSTWREHSPSTGGNSEVSTKSTLTWPRMSIPWVNLVKDVNSIYDIKPGQGCQYHE